MVSIRNISLPRELDELLFNELGGKYFPGQAVDNAENTQEYYNRYIGTYFPRSFVESYLIFKDAYTSNVLKMKFMEKDEINILDIGAGTGGNMLGLCYFFNRYGLSTKKIKFYTIEQYEVAINYQKHFINKFNEWYNTSIELIPTKMSFKLPYVDNFMFQLEQFQRNIGFDGKFDIITTFKFLGEFYNIDYTQSQGLYKYFTKIIEDFLSPSGLFLVLDVTSKDRNNIQPFYKAEIMSQELNQYTKDKNSVLKFILPLSCAQWYSSCETNYCFNSTWIFITHSKIKQNKDITKIAYRLFAHSDLAVMVLSEIRLYPTYIISLKKVRMCTSGILQKKIFGKLDFPDTYKFTQ